MGRRLRARTTGCALVVALAGCVAPATVPIPAKSVGLVRYTPATQVDAAFEVLQRDYVRVLDERALATRCARGLDEVLPEARRGVLSKAATRIDVSIALGAVRYDTEAEAVAVAAGCVRRMTEDLDRFTVFWPEEKLRDMSTGTQRYAVGLELQAAPNGARIVQAFDGTPAAVAGLRGNDILTHVDGKPLAGLDLEEMARPLRGALGSAVELTVLRQGREPAERFTLRRSAVRPAPVIGAKLVEPGVGYVVIDQFLDDARLDVMKAISRLRVDNGAPLRGLILDLRWCTGGLLHAGIGVAAVFLPDGAPVAELKGRSADVNVTFRAVPADYGEGRRKEAAIEHAAETQSVPLVVLVSRRTAAGGEIVAAALRDNGRARLIGTPTGGFGTVQTVVPLRRMGAIRLTTAAASTPRGLGFDEKGIEPDVAVDPEPMTPDAIAARAVRKLLPEPGDRTVQAALAALKAAPRGK